MAEPGWYPDPGGRAGHYRFWDGQSWGLGTTTELPGGATPAPEAGAGTARRRHGTRWLLVATALAVALVLVVVGALVVRERNRDAAGPGASTSATGGNDGPSSAVPSPPAETATPSPTPTPTPTPSAPPVECPVGDPFARQPYPEDGRAHGGGLAFTVPTGWTFPGVQTSAFTWAYDVGEADTRVQPNWFSTYAVGAVSTADGFEDPRSAAELILQCTLASDLYRNVLAPPQPVVRETTVDGYPALTLSAVIRVDDDRTTYEGDEVVITVVDLDSPESLAFFWGCAPIGDAGLVRQLEATAGSVTVG